MSDLDSITTISFDADGTLWDFQKVMRKALGHVLDALQEIDPVTAEKLTINKMITIRNRVASNLRGIITNLEEIRLRAFQETLLAINRPNNELALYLNQLYLKHRFQDIELYEDVLPTLKKLKAKYILGILSNGNSYPKKCGLKGMFDFVVFSQDYGVEKPNPRIFDVTLNKAKCQKNQLLHIGDSPTTDIAGSNSADIACIWLNRDNKKRPSNITINYEIKSLTELLDLL